MGSSEPAFYCDLSPDLSQGDIVQGLPPAVLQHPLTICRQGGKERGTARQGWFNTMVDANPPAFGAGPETLHARAARPPGLGMVIWEDCQIEKMQNQGKDPAKWYVAVAPVVSLDTINPDHRGPIAEGRRLAFFPLPSLAAVGLPASFVDFRLMWPIQQQALMARITRVSSEARATMYAHLFRFLTARQFPSELVCPSCHTIIDPKNLLEPATD